MVNGNRPIQVNSIYYKSHSPHHQIVTIYKIPNTKMINENFSINFLLHIGGVKQDQHKSIDHSLVTLERHLEKFSLLSFSLMHQTQLYQ